MFKATLKCDLCMKIFKIEFINQLFFPDFCNVSNISTLLKIWAYFYGEDSWVSTYFIGHEDYFYNLHTNNIHQNKKVGIEQNIYEND